jgi:hypothetical protein
MKAAGTETGIYIRTPYTAWKLESEQGREHHHVAIYLHSEQAETVEAWLAQLHEQVRDAEHDLEGARN